MHFADVIEQMKTDAQFRDRFTSQLETAPFESFRWESPPVTGSSIQSRAFECVIVDDPLLAAFTPDRSAFDEHFAGANSDDLVVAFPNLGGDALLIVPTPRAELAAYPHLAAFVRQAPPEQIDALWQRTATEVEARLSDRPVWLSTAGGGVPWIHVRLDSRPKYYRHPPYTLVDDT